MKSLIAVLLALVFSVELSCAQVPFRAKRVSINAEHAITLPEPSNPKLVRFEVRPGDFASNGSRSELMFTNLGNISHFEFSFKPKAFNYENVWFHIADWHVSTELYKLALKKGVKLYSPLMLSLDKGTIFLENRAGVYDGDVHSLKRKKGAKIKAYSAPLKTGWNKVKIDVVWSDKSDGQIIIEVNGNRKVISNVRTTYDLGYANFFKVGIYRSPEHRQVSVIDFKDIKVGNNSLVPDFKRKASGEQNNDPEIIKRYMKYQNRH